MIVHPDKKFQVVVNEVLVAEGVLSNNPNDKGGLTKYGITLPTMTDYLKATGANRAATKSDILALTPEKAAEIYYRLFWVLPRVQELPFNVAKDVFDFAVNSGIGRAVRYLQRVVGSTEDGSIGSGTIKAVTAYVGKYGERALSNQLTIQRGEYLIRLCQKDPSQLTFLLGWYNRIINNLDFAY